jgi:signal transduction histidine kinase
MGAGTPDAVARAALVYAGEVVARLVLDRRRVPEQLEAGIGDAVCAFAGEERAVRASVFDAAVNSRCFLELPPRIAVEAQLTLLAAFAPVRELSLWIQEDIGIECVAVVGATVPSRRVRRIATETLAGELSPTTAGAHLYGVPVVQWDRPRAALVLRTRPEDRDRVLAYAGESALALVPILEKETLLARNAAREATLVQSAERRLVRLGFDLHDGALQDLLAVASDLRVLRGQLVAGDADRRTARLAGALDDLASRVIATESEVRDLVQTLEAPANIGRPLAELVQIEVNRLASSGVTTSLRFDGSLDDFTPSQRIALLRFVEEAIENAINHSSASRASVSLAVGHAVIRADVTDDGDGFDVERVLVEAAKSGRLGLVGMGERIRLLGGRLEIVSRPGGPTSITAVIPRWKPSADGGAGQT